MIVAVVGGQYGDEGKGKFVHYLVHKEKIAMVGRGNGGSNAGHNVYDPERGISLALHLLPSGVVGDGTVNIIGCGVVFNPYNFLEELDMVTAAGVKLTPENLKVSTRAHLTLQTHRIIDGATDKVGSTAQGIGPTYRDKASRIGLRLEVFMTETWQERVRSLLLAHNEELTEEQRIDVEAELQKLAPAVERIRPFITDTVSYVHDQLGKGKSLIAEGAQATMLDINHGTYPYVTSSSTTASGVVTGLGVPARSIEQVIGVFKLPMTRVGKGPFTTRLIDEESEIHDQLAGVKGAKGAEFGATTGRARDIGWMDVVMARYAHRVNGFTELGLTKLDMLSGIPELKVCVAYDLDGAEIHEMPSTTAEIERCKPIYIGLPGWDEDIAGITDFAQLPKNAQKYVEFIENEVGVRASLIGTGPDNNDMIIR